MPTVVAEAMTVPIMNIIRRPYTSDRDDHIKGPTAKPRAGMATAQLTSPALIPCCSWISGKDDGGNISEHKIASLGKFMSRDGFKEGVLWSLRSHYYRQNLIFLPVLQFKGSSGSLVGCRCGLTPSLGARGYLRVLVFEGCCCHDYTVL